MYYVYVLQSEKDGGIYTGYTNDLRRRIAEHNDRVNQSTKGRVPLNIVYYEAYKSQADAKQREHNLKHSAGARTALKRRITDCLRSGHFV